MGNLRDIVSDSLAQNIYIKMKIKKNKKEKEFS